MLMQLLAVSYSAHPQTLMLGLHANQIGLMRRHPYLCSAGTLNLLSSVGMLSVLISINNFADNLITEPVSCFSFMNTFIRFDGCIYEDNGDVNIHLYGT